MLARLKKAIPFEGRLVFAAAMCMLLIGWYKGINLLILLALVLLAAETVNWIAAGRQMRRVRWSRSWPVPIFAGKHAHWCVSIANERPKAAAGFSVEDAGPVHRLSWHVDRLDGGGTTNFTGTAVFPNRGRQRFEPLRLTCQYPFGFVCRTASHDEPDECLVLPRLGRLNVVRFRHWLTRAMRSEGRLHRVARPSMARQDDLHGLRPFRTGDNPRWIHWRTSARRNMKMVREFEETSGMNLIVVVDPGSGASESNAGLEDALSLAATVCWEWCRNHEDYLMLAIASAAPEIRCGHTSRDLALRMLGALALVEGPRDGSAAALLKAVVKEIVPSAPVLLIGHEPNEPLRARLAAAWKRPVIALSAAATDDFYDNPESPLEMPETTPAVAV